MVFTGAWVTASQVQLRVLWEMLKRFEFVEVVATPERSYSTFIRGFKRLEVGATLASH